ncbi:MAG: hypothetical protein J6P98_09055, partial [Clostridia bacterium]|nr:hypothetical protein [Clostridia bacterium]
SASSAVGAALEKEGAGQELVFVSHGPAPIRKREDRYRYAVILKLARTKHTSSAIGALWQLADSFNVEGFRGVEINPNDML